MGLGTDRHNAEPQQFSRYRPVIFGPQNLDRHLPKSQVPTLRSVGRKDFKSGLQPT